MFAVCNVDYIIDVSSSDRIAKEHFKFLGHRFLKLLETSRRLLAFLKCLRDCFWKNCCGYRDELLEISRRLLAFSKNLYKIYFWKNCCGYRDELRAHPCSLLFIT